MLRAIFEIALTRILGSRPLPIGLPEHNRGRKNRTYILRIKISCLAIKRALYNSPIMGLRIKLRYQTKQPKQNLKKRPRSPPHKEEHPARPECRFVSLDIVDTYGDPEHQQNRPYNYTTHSDTSVYPGMPSNHSSISSISFGSRFATYCRYRLRFSALARRCSISSAPSSVSSASNSLKTSLQ